MRIRLKPLSIVLWLSGLLAACGTVSIGIETPTATPGAVSATRTPEPTALQAIPTPAATATAASLGEFKTLRSTFAGFELDYPAGWVLEETNVDLSNAVAGVVAYLYSEPPQLEPGKAGSEGIPPGLLKIDVVVASFTTHTLDQIAAEQKASILSSPMAPSCLRIA